MAIAISPIGNTPFEPRALRPLDDGSKALELRNPFDTDLNPTTAERLQDRLELGSDPYAGRTVSG